MNHSRLAGCPSGPLHDPCKTQIV